MREETYYHAIITYLYPTPYLGSFDHTPFSDMYEVRYTDWIESECSVYQFSSFMSRLAAPGGVIQIREMKGDVPLIYLPWGPDDRSFSY